jgi:hypothetical protein
MTHPRLTWHQFQPGFRITAKLGYIEVGAVIPPDERLDPWVYRFWLRDTEPCQAPSEQAAKDALTACVAEWLRDAGLEQVKEAGE